MNTKGLVLGVVLAVGLVGCGKTKYIVGPKGDTGPQGTQGPQGNPGADGEDGANGIDAASLSIVKLCPGTTTYPSKFVEVAFCINGKLYATYSQNGGLTTEIPPGSYGSNGINASCNFVVLPNCGIQN